MYSIENTETAILITLQIRTAEQQNISSCWTEYDQLACHVPRCKQSHHEMNMGEKMARFNKFYFFPNRVMIFFNSQWYILKGGLDVTSSI